MGRGKGLDMVTCGALLPKEVRHHGLLVPQSSDLTLPPFGARLAPKKEQLHFSDPHAPSVLNGHGDRAHRVVTIQGTDVVEFKTVNAQQMSRVTWRW